MNSHVIPTNTMHAPYVRTGYEAVLAVKSSDKYVVSAASEGKVTDVTDDEITVKYKDGSVVTHSIREWTSKEESGTSYTHKLTPNVKKGDTLRKDDTIAYDSSFFEPDVFDRKRVIYKQGTSANVALMEDPETYEDSGAISSEFAKTMETTVTKVKSVVVKNTDTIMGQLKVGDSVEPETPILSIIDAELGSMSDLDAHTLEILQGLKQLTPKASYRGVVSKIQIYYNCDKSTLSPTLKKMVNVSDKELKSATGYGGAVSSGYSIQGVPLLEDEVEIKYYFKVVTPMGTGDKAVIGNQLKMTIGNVYDNEITALDGTKIDCIFSSMSVEARIVNSPVLIGTTSKVLELVAAKASDLYFK